MSVVFPKMGGFVSPANYLGSFTWATKPTASASLAGATAYMTDVGVGGGSYWYVDGVRWRPVGRCVLAAGAGTTMSNPGHTNETELGSATVPAGAMGATGSVVIRTLWKTTNSANNKSIRIKFGGTNFVAYNATTSVTAYTEAVVNNLTASTQVGFNAASNTQNGVSASAHTSGSVNTANSVAVSITGQLATGTEECSLLHYMVEII